MKLSFVILSNGCPVPSPVVMIMVSLVGVTPRGTSIYLQPFQTRLIWRSVTSMPAYSIIPGFNAGARQRTPMFLPSPTPLKYLQGFITPAHWMIPEWSVGGIIRQDRQPSRIYAIQPRSRPVITIAARWMILVLFAGATIDMAKVTVINRQINLPVSISRY